MSTNQSSRLWLRILSGPAALLIVHAMPLSGLLPAGKFALATYAWVLAWWVSMPVPWAISGLLPLVLFPLGGAMPLADTVTLYGQRVLPFLLGIMLFGHAFHKHGLARRLATTVLSLPGVAVSGSRLLLVLMIVTALVSALVDDAAAVAIMLPIAVSVSGFASRTPAETSKESGRAPRLMEASCLATLYGASAGGLATPAGVPFNPLAISLLEQLTGYTVSFAQWTLTGVILMVAILPCYYAALLLVARPGTSSIAGGAAYFEQEKKTLGPMSRGERNVLIVLTVMVVLWLLPALVPIGGLDIWIVPPLAMMLLFVLPIDARKGEMTLGASDFQAGVLWNVLFLVVSGTAMAAGLVRLGVTEWLGGLIAGEISAAALPWLAGLGTPVLSHLTSGTATTSMVSTLLFPIAEELGYNPAILARIIAGTALAVSVPWAGAAAGTAFASGAIRLGVMFKVGVAVTVLTATVIVVLSTILVPALGAFTAP